MDIMHMLVAKNAVVICKSNPVLDYLGPFIECGLPPSARRATNSILAGLNTLPGMAVIHESLGDICMLRDAVGCSNKA